MSFKSRVREVQKCLADERCSVASDFIVALNAPQYGGGYPGPNCGRSITISYGGKSAQATIRDLCPGCGFGDLDMSRGLFNYFAVSRACHDRIGSS